MIYLHLVTAKIWGGGEQYVYNFCKEEQRRGNISYVVVDCSQIEIADRFSKVANVLMAKIRGIGGIRAYNTIVQFLEKNNVDGICCHSGSASLLAILLKKKFSDVKLLVFRHNLTPNKKDYYHKILQKTTDFFICVSNAVYETQIHSCYDEYKNKYRLLYTGIDDDVFYNTKNKTVSDVITIGYAGRIIENKGILILLEAFKGLIDHQVEAKLVLAGPMDENFKNKFFKGLENLQIADKVCVLGLCSDMNSFYNSLDIFVLPSIVKESFGLVICEAMACGVPVITTNSGAQEEIITHDMDGLIVNPGDVQALFNALVELALNSEKREKISLAAETKVKKIFLIRKLIDNIESL